MLSSPALHLENLGTAEPAGPALSAKGPREILARFDSERDLEMRHPEALALLRALGAHESADPAVRVGTAWAHLHEADRSQRTRDGLAWIDASRASVAQLEASGASADPFAAYVLVRWHAAAGRIRLACGHVQAACAELTIAAKRCARKDLSFLRPEILSDLQWARTEKERAAGGEGMRTAVRRFSRLREVMNRLAGRRGIDLGAVTALAGDLARWLSTGGSGELGAPRDRFLEVIGACDVREARRRSEMLRGLVHLHLMRARLLAPSAKRRWAGDRERSRELGWWCARAAFGAGDRYRLAQALDLLSSLDS